MEQDKSISHPYETIQQVSLGRKEEELSDKQYRSISIKSLSMDEVLQNNSTIGEFITPAMRQQS